jgi:hypothetical protein
MSLPLAEDETAALVRLLRDAIDGDRYQFSSRMVLKEILGKLRPEPARAAVSPEPRIYEPRARGDIAGDVSCA